MGFRTLYHSFRDFLVALSCLFFHVTFRINLSSARKNKTKIHLLGLDLCIKLGRTEVFVMPSYSIHEHEIRNVFPFVQVYFYVFQKCFPPIDLAFFLSFLSILSFWCYWKWRLDFYHIFNYSLFYLLCTYRKYWVLFANSISCHFTQFLLFRCSVVIDSLGFSTYTITSSARRNSFPSSFPTSYASNYSLLIECANWFRQYNVIQYIAMDTVIRIYCWF